MTAQRKPHPYRFLPRQRLRTAVLPDLERGVGRGLPAGPTGRIRGRLRSRIRGGRRLGRREVTPMTGTELLVTADAIAPARWKWHAYFHPFT